MNGEPFNVGEPYDDHDMCTNE